MADQTWTGLPSRTNNDLVETMELVTRRADDVFFNVSLAQLKQFFASAPAFSASVTLKAGALVWQDSKVYRAKTDLAAGAFNAASFDLVAGGSGGGATATGAIAPWGSATGYVAGDTVTTPGGDIVFRTADGSSGGTFDGAEAAAWTLLFVGPPMTAFPATVYIYAGRILFADAPATTDGKAYSHTVSAVTGANLTIDIANWLSLIDAAATAGGGVSAWAGTTVYAIDDVVVTPGGDFVIATTAHTSAASFAAANWALLALGAPLATYSASTYIYAGRVLLATNPTTSLAEIYSRTAAGTTTAAFNLAEEVFWTSELALSAVTVFPAWVAATVYAVGDVVVSPTGAILRSTSAHTSAATFTTASGEAGDWELILIDTSTAWAGSAYYFAGQTVAQGETVLRRTSAGDSQAIFNSVEANNWDLISQASVGAFTGSTAVVAGFKINHEGTLYERIATGTTSAVWGIAQSATWLALGRPAGLINAGETTSFTMNASTANTTHHNYVGTVDAVLTIASDTRTDTTMGAVAWISNEGTGILSLVAAATLTGGVTGETTFYPGQHGMVMWANTGLTAQVVKLDGDDQITLLDEMFEHPTLSNTSVARMDSPWGDGHVLAVDDTSASTGTISSSLGALAFVATDTYQMRFYVAASALANQVIELAYVDDSNSARILVNIGTAGVQVVGGGVDVGNVTSTVVLKVHSRGTLDLIQVDMTMTWTGVSGANPFIFVTPAYNLDGTAIAVPTAVASLSMVALRLGAPSEFYDNVTSLDAFIDSMDVVGGTATPVPHISGVGVSWMLEDTSPTVSASFTRPFSLDVGQRHTQEYRFIIRKEMVNPGQMCVVGVSIDGAITELVFVDVSNGVVVFDTPTGGTFEIPHAYITESTEVGGVIAYELVISIRYTVASVGQTGSITITPCYSNNALPAQEAGPPAYFPMQGLVPDTTAQGSIILDGFQTGVAGSMVDKFDKSDEAQSAGRFSQVREAWLIIGQSNASGYSGTNSVEAMIDTVDNRILMRSAGFPTTYYEPAAAGEYQVAQLPLQFPDLSGTAATGVSPGMAFARERLALNPEINEIVLLPMALGGSSFNANDWNSGDVLFTNAVAAANEAVAKGYAIGGFLWVQGEGDAGLGLAGYQTALLTMISAIRSAIETVRTRTPFIIGTMQQKFVQQGDTAVSGASIDMLNIQNALVSMPSYAAGLGTEGVYLADSRDLLRLEDDGTYGTVISRNIHFSAPQQRDIGRRMAHTAQIAQAEQVGSGNIYQAPYRVYALDGQVTEHSNAELTVGDGVTVANDPIRGEVMRFDPVAATKGVVLSQPLNRTEYTIMFWVKVDDVLNNTPLQIFMGGDPSPAASGATVTPHFIGLANHGHATSASVAVTANELGLVNDVWSHVTMVFTPGAPNVFQTYVDGTIQLTANSVDSDFPTVSEIQIGQVGNGASGFAGYIDDFRVYHNAWLQANTDSVRLATLTATPKRDAAPDTGSGIAKKGFVTADADDGEGIYSLNAAGAAFDFTLPVATGSQERRIFICDDVATNNVTVKVQVGNSMNDATNGTFTCSVNGQVLQAIDRVSGKWVVSVIGAGAATTLDYARIISSTNRTPVVGATLLLNVDGGQSVGTTIDTGAGTITITKDGLYALRGLAMVRDATGINRIRVDRNGVEVVTGPSTSASTAGEDNPVWVNSRTALVVGDVMSLVPDAVSGATWTALSLEVEQVPNSEVVLAGMVTPTPLSSASIWSNDDATVTGRAVSVVGGGADVLDFGHVQIDGTEDLNGMLNIANNYIEILTSGRYTVEFSGKLSVAGSIGVRVEGVEVRSQSAGTQAFGLAFSQLFTIGDRIEFSGSEDFNSAQVHVRELATATVVNPGAVVPATLDYFSGWDSSMTAPGNGNVFVLDGVNESASGLAMVAGVVTIAKAGTYRVRASLLEATTNERTFGRLFINGASTGPQLVNNMSNAVSKAMSASFEDILVLGVGDTVEVRQDSVTALGSPGVSLVVQQVATLSVVRPEDVAVNDQAASGYVDIGTMRMAWGTISSTTSALESFVFPVPFLAAPNVVMSSLRANHTAPIDPSVVSTTGFSIDRDGTIAGTHTVFYQAIGLIP